VTSPEQGLLCGFLGVRSHGPTQLFMPTHVLSWLSRDSFCFRLQPIVECVFFFFFFFFSDVVRTVRA
jgi:hypothetical protein